MQTYIVNKNINKKTIIQPQLNDLNNDIKSLYV